MDAYDVLSRRRSSLERRWSECEYDAAGYAIATELLGVAELWTLALRARAERLFEVSERRAQTFVSRAQQKLTEVDTLAHDLQRFADQCREELSPEVERQARERAGRELRNWISRHRSTIEDDIGRVHIGVPADPFDDDGKAD